VIFPNFRATKPLAAAVLNSLAKVSCSPNSFQTSIGCSRIPFSLASLKKSPVMLSDNGAISDTGHRFDVVLDIPSSARLMVTLLRACPGTSSSWSLHRSRFCATRARCAASSFRLSKTRFIGFPFQNLLPCFCSLPISDAPIDLG